MKNKMKNRLNQLQSEIEEREKKILEDKRIAEEKLVISERKAFLNGLGFVQELASGDFFLKGSKTIVKIFSSQFLTKDPEEWQQNAIKAEESAKRILQENEAFDKALKKKLADDAVEAERLRVEEKNAQT